MTLFFAVALADHHHGNHRLHSFRIIITTIESWVVIELNRNEFFFFKWALQGTGTP